MTETVKLQPLALIESELLKRKMILLHPLIDYHEDVGFSMGTLIDSVSTGSSQSLIFLADSVFIADFEAQKIPEAFPTNVQLKRLNWLSIQPEWNAQILLLAADLIKKEPSPFPSKNEVFQKAFQILNEYWFHSDKRYLTLITCWIIGTYFHPIFSFYPALNVQGQRETGKSTLLDILSRTCWNPTGRETAIRGADIFRTVEGTRGTYIIDITRFNLKNDDTKDVVDLIETGTEKGGKVRRINKDTLKPQEFEVYSPKAIATRYELPFTVKCIRIITEKAPKEYSQRRARLPFDKRFNETVKLLIRGAVKYWREIVEAYRTMQQTEKLNGRAFNYWAPILSVCKVFHPEGYEKLLSLAEEYAVQQNASDRLSEVEDAVLTVCLNYLNETSSLTMTVSLKDLTEKVHDLVPWIQSWHIVKSALQNLGISKRKYGGSGGVKYQLDLQRAREKAEQRGIIENSNENNAAPSREPYFRQCYFCGEPIFTDDWVSDEFTDYRPVHVECYNKKREEVKRIK